MSGTEAPKRTVRVHGMNAPYHPLQILTWIIYPLLVIQYYVLMMPLLGSLIFQVITGVIFGISAIVAVVAGGITATSDPADDACLGKDNDMSVPTVMCYLCEVYVESSSKHCRTCGKCVQNFDHHCKWLNTCVGKKNYRYFLILMGGVAVMTTLSLGLCAYLSALCFLDKDKIKSRIEDSSVLDGVVDYWTVVSMLLVSGAILLPLVLLLYQLIGFHAMLVKRGITTYDYIVSEQKRLREKKRAKAEAKAEASRAASSSSSAVQLPTKHTPAAGTSLTSSGGLEMRPTGGRNQDQDEDNDNNNNDDVNDDNVDDGLDHEDDQDDDHADSYHQRNGAYAHVPIDDKEMTNGGAEDSASSQVVTTDVNISNENEEAV
mmetsp:Transcript_26202/g.44181  ORF Transcript_26202/g.44181 Transcript_26202/m.44181 type:complete len:375 (-) Transcript_26202:163-1287(-)